MRIITRPARSLAALVAIALTVLLPLVALSGSADAATSKALKHHTVSVKVKQTGRTHFKMSGTVSPKYHNRKVQILRQDKCKGVFKLDHVTDTDGSGIFVTPIGVAPHESETCWRAKVPAGNGYAADLSDAYKIYKI